MKETFGNSGGVGVGGCFFTKMEIPERWGVFWNYTIKLVLAYEIKS